MKKFLWIFAIVAVIVVVVVWLARPKIYAYVILKLVERRREIIAPNREVVWERGPSVADSPLEERPPNIVVILADDLGYNDLTFGGGGVGNGAVPTPNIDSIAQEGVVFINGFANNATCAPSRASIMTGRYATRFGFEFTPAPKEFAKVIHSIAPGTIYHKDREKDHPPLETMGVPPEEITIAELLKQKDYHTLMLGKWHLGGSPSMRPEDQGFDEWLGFFPGAAMFLPEDHPDVVNSKQDFDPIDRFLWAALPYSVREENGEEFQPKGYLTDYLTDEAVKAIEANKNRPFFLYLSHAAVHTPLQALRSDYDALPQIKDHTTRVYGGMVRALDRSVGRVLQALKENGLEENTIVIFTTDNGGAHYIGLPDINKPYRGWKATFYEGGIHAPFFMKWPAALQKGMTYDAPIAHFDIFSTAAAAAGISVPDDRIIDGTNLLPYLKGEQQGRPHDVLFWKSGHYKTVLAGDWKLQTAERPKMDRLYNLAEDPTEQVNLAEGNPQKVSKLKALLAEHEKEIREPAWPSLLEGRIAIDHPGNIPLREGDEFIYWSN